MKRKSIAICMVILLLPSVWVIAQQGNKKSKIKPQTHNPVTMQDGILLPAYKTTSGQVQPAQGGVNNTKLDDLKNPFDTTKKVVGTQPENFSWGASNPTGQNQRTAKPGASHNAIDTSMRLGVKSQTENFSWGEHSEPGTKNVRVQNPQSGNVTVKDGKKLDSLNLIKKPVSGSSPKNVQGDKYANQETNYRSGQSPAGTKPAASKPGGLRRKKL